MLSLQEISGPPRDPAADHRSTPTRDRQPQLRCAGRRVHIGRLHRLPSPRRASTVVIPPSRRGLPRSCPTFRATRTWSATSVSNLTATAHARADGLHQPDGSAVAGRRPQVMWLALWYVDRFVRTRRGLADERARRRGRSAVQRAGAHPDIGREVVRSSVVKCHHLERGRPPPRQPHLEALHTHHARREPQAAGSRALRAGRCSLCRGRPRRPRELGRTGEPHRAGRAPLRDRPAPAARPCSRSEDHGAPLAQMVCTAPLEAPSAAEGDPADRPRPWRRHARIDTPVYPEYFRPTYAGDGALRRGLRRTASRRDGSERMHTAVVARSERGAAPIPIVGQRVSQRQLMAEILRGTYAQRGETPFLHVSFANANGPRRSTTGSVSRRAATIAYWVVRRSAGTAAGGE
mgnify:CR=1 FL=1